MRVRELAPPVYRVRAVEAHEGGEAIGRRVTAPSAVAALLHALPVHGARLELLPVEVFGVLLLNGRHCVQSFAVLSVGCLDASIVHPREVFRAAILGNASAVILFHNHPSGDPEPSADDIALTERMMAAGVLMGINVLDHIITGYDGRYSSFRERGRL